MVSIGPEGDHDHSARDPRALASCRLSAVLALEIPFLGRPAANCCRPAAADPTDERGQSAVGAPRIHGELLKLGFDVAQSTVAKYMAKGCGPSFQGWLTFLRNHAPNIAAMDLFVVPTIGFDLLCVFLIVRLERRDLVWINVTANPSAEWIARQITEAFPWILSKRLLQQGEIARGHNADRRGAFRDTTVEGYRHDDRDVFQSVSGGNLNVLVILRQSRVDDHHGANIESIEREDGRREYRPDDKALPELQQRSVHQLRQHPHWHQQRDLQSRRWLNVSIAAGSTCSLSPMM
jgi:hypothetical protein